MVSWAGWLGWGLGMLVGCEGGPGEESSAPEQTSTPMATVTPLSLCVDAPVVTWANFLEGFMLENCQTCHASTTLERYGAPVEVTFDEEAEVLKWEARILARATGESPSMPPGGGVSPEDRLLLEISLVCWE